ncbi:hypothetical protein [Nostoc sp. C117]|uniref:hypothetical protein n=1 Tax=Nostoc sp. C117 TaxID=3349875 RepID=UPI00370D9E40
MKIILDENLPKALKRYLSADEVTTVQEQGWAGVKNGELMVRIDGNTSRLRGKGERVKGKKKPLTLTLYPFPQTRFRVKNA